MDNQSNLFTAQPYASTSSLFVEPHNDKEHKLFESLSSYENLRITDLTPIPEPEPVLLICGEVVATCDEFSVISGAPKSGKSAFVSMCISSAISETGQTIDSLEGLELKENVEKKAVIHIDTEQARHKQQHNLKTILTRAGCKSCPDHFLSYNIRKEEIGNYEAITTGICAAAFKTFGGIHSIWIDGGADYIEDVNDTKPANASIKYFGDLAEKYHTAVIVNIHTNPNSTKLRGNFGSQGQRKTGGNVLVSKDKNEISSAEIHDLRYGGGGARGLTFKYDKEKGYHVGCEPSNLAIGEEAKASKKIRATWEVCQKVFSKQKSYRYEQTIKEIMKVKACGERTAVPVFTQMKTQEMIIQREDKNWCVNQLFNNEI